MFTDMILLAGYGDINLLLFDKYSTAQPKHRLGVGRTLLSINHF